MKTVANERNGGNPTSGIALVDKPTGWTSHDVVGKSRRLFNTRKVGHAGTLDPMATGLLILGVNSSTRLLTFFVGLDKEYEATIRLGASTTTDDAEGELLGYAPATQIARITDDDIRTALVNLTGDILQVPSSVSAIKVNGERAYARVRAGEQVNLAARPVTISECELRDVRHVFADGHPVIDLDVRVSCSSGTYIRAIARDVGFALGTGGHLTALRRTRVGPFDVTEASHMPSSREETTETSAPHLLTPAEAAVRVFPELVLSDEQARDLMHGKRPVCDHADAPQLAALDSAGRLIGLVSVSGAVVKSLVNFPTDE